MTSEDLAAEPTELFAHLRLEQRSAQELQNAVVDAPREWMRRWHGPSYLEDWTAVGAMPWVIA